MLKPYIVQLAGAKVGLSEDCGYKLQVRSFGQRVAANCAALPTANAGQYAF